MGRSAFTNNKDRFFGAIVYLLALADVMSSGAILISIIPALSPVFGLLGMLLFPVLILYGIIGAIIPGGFGSLIVFFALIIGVVQNDKISYFIRFNTMQSILIGIALSLIQILTTTLPLPSLIVNTIGGITFLVVMPICLYCLVQSALGKYPEIPSFSKFVYDQVR